ncbi:glycosyltransferase family 4 protein [Salinispirillum marinum]|uniref:Glycosyltransferase family 4 protein n=2 Tax=Saccharospirillaceae TaxID=255527 RepID=A0ABV8BD40_9GAMM
MNNRIVILNQWFDPEPTFKGLLFAKELKKKGFEVEVVTGFPNYPGGRLYKGYKLGIYKREVIDGIKIHRVFLYPSHDASKIRRILNYGSFALSSLIFCLFFLKKPKAIYVYHPPLTTGVTATILSKIRRIPFVYDIQDLWPDTLKSTGMINSIKALKIIDKVASFIYKEAKKIVVLSEGFKVKLEDRGVNPDKISVVYNWADERFIQPIEHSDEEKKPLFNKNSFNVLYAGNFGIAQELTALLGAAELLKNDDRIHIYLMGDGQERDRLVKLKKVDNLTNVTILNSVPLSEISEYLNSASALFIHLKNDPLFEITIPGKTQSYMATGKPIIMGVSGAAAELITKSNCGILAESSNTSSIANAILMMSKIDKNELEQMGKRGRRYYENELSLNSGVDKFANIFNSL